VFPPKRFFIIDRKNRIYFSSFSSSRKICGKVCFSIENKDDAMFIILLTIFDLHDGNFSLKISNNNQKYVFYNVENVVNKMKTN
jgi:hypothetical protein